MNRLITLLALMLISGTAVWAQFRNVGVGLAYGTEVEQPGIGFNGQFFVNDQLAIVPSLIFYFPNQSTLQVFNTRVETRLSVWEFNADVNYYFFDQGVKLYGIGGLNITGESSRIKTENNGGGNRSVVRSSDSSAGLNLGIGADFSAGSVIPFVLMKYTVSDFDQLVLFAGVRIPINQ